MISSSTEIQSFVPWRHEDRKQMRYPLDHDAPQTKIKVCWKTYFMERLLPVSGTKGWILLCILEVTTSLAFVKENQSLRNVIILKMFLIFQGNFHLFTGKNFQEKYFATFSLQNFSGKLQGGGEKGYLYECRTCRYVRFYALNVLHVHGPRFNASNY